MRLFVASVAVVAVLLSGAGRAAQDEEVFDVGPGVTSPKPTKTVNADYDREAMRDRVQGRVALRAVVNTAGRPTRIEVVESLDTRLDANAVEALEQWEFEPGLRAGKPAAVRITVEMTFTLK